METLWEILVIVLLSSVKFLFALGTALLAGYGYVETVLMTSIGGIMGVMVFYYFGEFINAKFQQWLDRRKKKQKQKRTFTKRNKLIVKTKITYGLIGLALLTPIFLSIPLGCILAARFFRQNRSTLPVLIFFVLFWSLVITGIGYAGKWTPE